MYSQITNETTTEFFIVIASKYEETNECEDVIYISLFLKCCLVSPFLV